MNPTDADRERPPVREGTRKKGICGRTPRDRIQLGKERGEEPEFCAPPDRCPGETGYLSSGPSPREEAGRAEHVLTAPGWSTPPGRSFVMAGSYQPEAMQQIARIEAPAFVAVVGKPNLLRDP